MVATISPTTLGDLRRQVEKLTLSDVRTAVSLVAIGAPHRRGTRHDTCQRNG